MVIDSLDNASLYESVHSGFQAAFQFLQECMQNLPEAGRYEIDGTNVYAMVQKYDTSPANQIRWEAHRNYIDIQCLLRGKEKIGYVPLTNLQEETPYHTEKDCVLAQSAKDENYIHIPQGSFAIFYPQDAHKPRCMADASEAVWKVVVKVRL